MTTPDHGWECSPTTKLTALSSRRPLGSVAGVSTPAVLHLHVGLQLVTAVLVHQNMQQVENLSVSRYGDQKQDHQLQNNLDDLESVCRTGDSLQRRLIIYFNKTHPKYLQRGKRWFFIEPKPELAFILTCGNAVKQGQHSDWSSLLCRDCWVNLWFLLKGKQKATEMRPDAQPTGQKPNAAFVLLLPPCTRGAQSYPCDFIRCALQDQIKTRSI